MAEAESKTGNEPKLLDRLAQAVAARSISPRIEAAYIEWCRQFILFHNKRHPNELTKNEIQAFLRHLAESGRVSSSGLQQARSAIAFLYREVLEGSFPWLVAVHVPKCARSQARGQRTPRKTTRAARSQQRPGRRSPNPDIGTSSTLQPYQEAMAELLEQVHKAIRVRQYSFRTEKSYAHWISRFVAYHGNRHPIEMGASEIGDFLTHLATEGHVGGNTQKQALCALVFLYKHVLEVEIGIIEGVVQAKRPQRLPVVLEPHEIESLFKVLSGICWMDCMFQYGGSVEGEEWKSRRAKELKNDSVGHWGGGRFRPPAHTLQLDPAYLNSPA